MHTQQAWQSAISLRENPAYEYDGLKVTSIPQNLPFELLKELGNGRPIITGQNAVGTKNTLMIPLMLLNQVIGVIGLEQEDPHHAWTEGEIAIAQAAANRAALTLETPAC